MTRETVRVIAAEDDGIRLDRWFRRHYPGLAQGQLEKAARKGLIRLEGQKPKMSTRVVGGQEVRIKFLDLEGAANPAPSKAAAATPTPEQIAQTREWVLYRNAGVIAVNKPAGLAVQGGSNMRDHLDRRLPALQFDAPEPPRLVHRLDKDTSGVLLLGRNARAATELTRAFAGKHTQKQYWALVVGVPEPRDGEIEGALAKSGSDYAKMTVEDSGKPAITRYRVLETLGDRLALVELEPVTGRTHQLRVHMATLGYPILGDGKYGGKGAFISGLALPRQLHLHARHIAIHGLSGGDISVTAPLPAHMQHTFELLGLSY